MLYRIHTGFNVELVDQADIVYLVSTAQAVSEAGLGFVFTDRHSLASVATFYDHLDELSNVDFDAAYAKWWNATATQPDRQEKKQAEFLVHGAMLWSLISELGVLDERARQRVESLLQGCPATIHRPLVAVRGSWYY